MPREILSREQGSLTIAPYEEHPIAAGQIRVKTEFAAPKHGTETHGFFSSPDDVPMYYDSDTMCFLPQTDEMREAGKARVFKPGNMWVGHVIEVGEGVTEFKAGDRLAGYGSLRETHTQNLLNINQAGLGTSADILRVPDSMPWQAAVCFYPCQFALCGVRDAHIKLGDAVCVMGLGAIGLMAVQMAKMQGARIVIASDPIVRRREIALKLGVDHVLDSMAQDVGLEIKRLTGNLGADAVIETSGTYSALQASLRGVAYGGRVSVVGWYKACKGHFDLGQEAHMNNATLFFSRACSEPNPDYPRWNWSRINDTCWDLLTSGDLRCEEIIDPIVPFEAAADTYMDVVVQHPDRSVKMGVRFDG